MREFWENQALKYKEDVMAVNFDPLGEDLELFFLEKHFQDGEKVCDIGCGNGRTILHLARQKKDTEFFGVDFAEGMIDIANSSKKAEGVDNVHFMRVDATDDLKSIFDFKFDKVMTKRLLINIKGPEKFKAVENIGGMLKDRGIYIMTECFMEPLQRINEIRKQLSLDEITVKHFNEYLSADFLREINGSFEVEETIDFQSLYYFVSRVFNAALSEGNPDYHAPMNMLALDLIKKGINPIKGYSPEVMHILRKK